MQRLKPSFGALYHALAGNTAYPGPRPIFGDGLRAGPPCLFWPSPSHIVLFSLPHAGSPSLRYPRPHYHHTASYNITWPDIDMHATEDKTGASAPAARQRLPFPHPHPHPIPCPPLPRYALALFVRVHLGEDEAVTLQRRVTTV